MAMLTTKRRWIFSRARPLLILGMVLILAVQVQGQQPRPDEPLPLKRIVIPAARLPQELERVRQGMLLQLPRADLEGRVAKALTAADNIKNPPRLVRASYTAELSGNTLVQGSGLWRILNPSGQAALCSLGELNLAIGRVRTATGGDAIFGELDGKALGVLIQETGSQTFFFDWTLRGLASSGGLYFEMRLPPAPVAQLELKLPADRVVSMSKSMGLVSGPHQTDNPKQLLWHLHFSGRRQVEFFVRQNTDRDSNPPLLVSHVQTRQQILPDRVLADYDFQVEVLQQGVSELVFDCDPLLQPYEITLRSVDWKGWQFKEAVVASQETAKAAPKQVESKAAGTLVLQLREPFQGTLTGLRIRCLAPGPLQQSSIARQGEGGWHSPAVRLRHGLRRGESLKILFHPEVFPARWDAGTFRLAGGSTEKDGYQELSLFDLSPSLASRRPMVVFNSQGIDLHVQQCSWWRLGPVDTTIDCELVYELNRGSLSQLSWKLPRNLKDWLVESVAMEPSQALRTWTMAGSLVMADLARPLVSGSKAKIRVRLRAPLPTFRPVTSLALDFGDLEPVEPCLREGIFAISVLPPFQAVVLQSSLARTVTDKEGPWQATPVSFAFRHRNQPSAGKLQLLPQPARLQARQVTDVFLKANHKASWQTRVELEAIEGAPQVLNLFFSAPVGDLQVRLDHNQVIRLERLPALEVAPFFLGLGACWSGPALPTLLSLGQHWRIQLARPLAKRDALVLSTTLTAATNADVAPPPGANQRWYIPLPTILDAQSQKGDCLVHLVDTDLVEVSGRGCQGVTLAHKGSEQPGLAGSLGGRKLYRFARVEQWPYPSLELCSRPLDKAPENSGIYHYGELLTIVGPRRQLLHLFRIQLQNWPQQECAVLLPAGIKRVVAARVNDHFLGQIPHEETPEGVRVRLPLEANSAVQEVAIFYAEDHSPSWWPWATLSAPAPRLPVPPRTFRHLWRLPPDLVPLNRKAFLAKESPLRRGDWRAWLPMIKRTWHGSDLLPKGLSTSGAEEWIPAQRQTLLAAETALRQKMSPQWPLGEALERLECEHLKGQLNLVLDGEALHELGVGPALTLMPKAQTGPGGERPPFWENAELVYVPCRAGALLTSRQQLDTWQAQGGPEAMAATLTSAVAEAAQYGQDSSGRFRTVLNWLEENRNGRRPRAADIVDQSRSAGIDWEALAGVASPEQLVVVRQGPFQLAGFFLAAIFLLATWRLRLVCSPAWRLRLWVIGTTTSAIAWWWVPGALRPALVPVLAAATLVALFWYLHRLWGVTLPPRRGQSTVKVLKASLLPFLLGVVLASPWLSPAVSQGPDPFTVLLVEGQKPDQQMALVTPDLLKKLDELGQKSLMPQRGAVLLGAHYRGTISGQAASFQADYEVYSFAERTVLAVPLAGVDLQEGSLLAGVGVYPVPLAAPLAGYSVVVPGKGFQRLTLFFSVRLLPDQTELKFNVPRLARNHLSLSLSSGHEAMQAVQAAGWQELTPARPNQPAQLQVHLGRESLVHLRWRPDRPESAQVQAEVREAYFWDLRASGMGLSAFLQYSVTKGNLGALAIALPEPLIVRAVEVESLGKDSSTRLRNWRVVGQGNNRQLQIELVAPSPAQFQVNLLLAPQLMLNAPTWHLPLPLPLKVKATEGFLAYRLEGVDGLDKGQNLAVTSMTPEAFGRVWRLADRRESGLPSAAYTFRRTAGAAALILTVKPHQPEVRQEISWLVGKEQADLQATLSWRALQEPTILLEVEVPAALTLTGVKGTEVLRWVRFGSRVQIWLKKAVKETVVELAGWSANSQKVSSGKKEGLFSVPFLGLPNSRSEQVRLHILPTPGLQLLPQSLKNLQAEPSSGGGSPAHTYAAGRGTSYEGTFRLHSQPVLPEVRHLTCLEGSGAGLELSSYLDIRLGQSELQALEIVLRHWPGGEVRLEGPAGVEVQQLSRKDNELRWKVSLAAGVPRQVALKLSGRAALPVGVSQPVPEVLLPGPVSREHWLAVLGAELNINGGPDMAKIAEVEKVLALWPAEAEKIARRGMAWRKSPQPERWQMRYAPSNSAPQLRLLLAEQKAVMADSQRWLHQGDYLLMARGAAEVHVVMPVGAQLLMAVLDEVLVLPMQPQPGQLRIPLSESAGLRSLRLQWTYPATAADVLNPALQGPVFPGSEEVPVVGRLWLPTGYELARPVGTAGLQLDMTDFYLQRARAQLQVASYWAESDRQSGSSAGKEQMWVAQRRFVENARRASWQLALARRLLGDQAAAVVLRQKNLETLQTQNKQVVQDMEMVALDQELARAEIPGALAAEGLPVTWRTTTKAAAPSLTLALPALRESEEAVAASQILLLMAAGFWFLSFWQRWQRWIHLFWPEQVVLLALLGYHFFGLSLLGLLLLFLGLGGRLLLLAASLHHLLFRSPSQAAGPES